MATPASGFRISLDMVLERYTEEVRGGTAASISQYARRYPHLADEIEELFPLVAGLEKCKAAQDADFFRQNFPDEFPLRQLGDCTLVREIGRGGMGIVFEATQGPAERAVAIKLLPSRFLADRLKSKERFQREAVTIAQLKHQNIVPIYSFGEHDGYYFYVMQLVRGVSLDWVIHQLRVSTTPICSQLIHQIAGGDSVIETDQLQPSALPSHRQLQTDSWGIFAKIGIQIAMGISHAHSNQVLHDDIKPANLLLNVAGLIVITDFGGSYQPKTARGRSTNQSFTGTLRYMAPERLRGRSSPRSDIYSIGMTLYELVTQQAAFDTDDRSHLAELIVSGSWPTPRDICPEIPVELERIILTALARDPAARYSTAKAMADDLRRFVKQFEASSRSGGSEGRGKDSSF